MSQFDFSDMFKNLGAMRGQMEQIKARLARMQIIGEAGAGMVKATVNGEGEVQKVDIDPALLTPNDRVMLEELIVSAVNDASKKARDTVAHEMRSIAGGLPIPGLDKLFGM
jgi:nucleoid-associated protein EbfC